jgi:hypothetical protein
MREDCDRFSFLSAFGGRSLIFSFLSGTEDSIPGAFLYRWKGLRFEDKDGKTLLISRGVQDTLPLRWNSPREVLIVGI